MEVISKQLHKSALPLIFAVSIALIVSSLLMANLGNIVDRALVTQVMHVNPGSNGLAHVSFNSEPHELGNSIHQAGQDVSHSLVLDFASKNLDN